MTTGSSPRRNARRERLILLGYFETHSVTGVVFDKSSRDQAWLIEQGFIKAEIEHHPPNSDWPRIIVKITELGRAALDEFRHTEREPVSA
jgi:hypothetical protein